LLAILLTSYLNIIVIGGGAAGFFGAICAATHPHTQFTLLEAGSTPLTKVRISGGGRCNVTHHCFDPSQLVRSYPRGGKELRGAFTRFQPKDTIAWFESRGVRLKTEEDGRMFPITDSSETIVNCLMEEAKKTGVQLRTNAIVKSVKKERSGFEITLKTGEKLSCDRLLIATGSNPLGYRFARELGHTIESLAPSLFTFNIKDPRLQDLAGVSVENAYIRLLDNQKTLLEQTEPLLITHWGMSGPAVLKLSAWGARILHENRYKMSVKVNWIPPYNTETLQQHLLEFKANNPKRKVYSYSSLSLPKRLWQKLVDYAGIAPQIPWAELSKKSLEKLVTELTQGEYKIQGKGVFKEEFVTCGGVKLKEVDFKTMESKICPNLYFAGEVLDIDGITGGFNFQSAWTTSCLAGNAMGKLQ
jgi:predicted Rossmann fold flavoprotein